MASITRAVERVKSTPDTPALREAFGQPAGMKPGCGFPPPE